MKTRNPELKAELELLKEAFSKLGLGTYQIEQMTAPLTDAEELKLIEKIRTVRKELEAKQ